MKTNLIIILSVFLLTACNIQVTTEEDPSTDAKAADLPEAPVGMTYEEAKANHWRRLYGDYNGKQAYQQIGFYDTFIAITVYTKTPQGGLLDLVEHNDYDLEVVGEGHVIAKGRNGVPDVDLTYDHITISDMPHNYICIDDDGSKVGCNAFTPEQLGDL